MEIPPTWRTLGDSEVVFRELLRIFDFTAFTRIMHIMKTIRRCSLCLAFILYGLTAYAQAAQEPDVFRHIRENKTDSIAYFLEQGNDVNGLHPRNTLLEIAIVYNQIDVVKLLIDRKANVNLQNNRSTPLFLSVVYGQNYDSNEITELLVAHEADVNFVGVNGFTPLILASKLNNSPAAKFLYEHDADPAIKDRAGNDFFYYVLRGNDPSLVQYFVSRGFVIPRMSSVEDGPYVRLPGNGAPLSHRMRYDSLTDRAEWLQHDLGEVSDGLPDREAIESYLKKYPLKYSDEYRKVGSIFVVSDIHGHYDHFLNLLRANGIIDANLEWTFGKGHLVIDGDVFDRGDRVTECLWLIFNLEQQAEKHGGMVHYLLGNHELLILKDNDKNYAHEKYILPYAKAGIDYHDLFSREYVLGQWLRTKNIAVKINRLLFVHGGIPPYFADQKRTIEQMNQSINIYMTDTSGVMLDGDDVIIEPMWYRGYFENTDMGSELAMVCKYYKVDKIIVGHTPVDHIKLLQDNYVIGVGVHFNGPDRPAQGLLISNDKFYRCDEKGHKTEL
jgi:hypothetical protein